ncbi:MAG TPA: hypothetical protein VG755_07435 [Nannocystaceae bacterium]|nr:hypothetical protein [Nannocystaceae bacterium]
MTSRRFPTQPSIPSVLAVSARRTKARRVLTTALCLLALQPAVLGVAEAAPKRPTIGSQPQTRLPKAYFEHIQNGKLEVDPGCATEFPNWTRKLEFYDRPSPLCVRWIEKTKTEWARWELYKDNGQLGGQLIGSGQLSESSLEHATSSFKIQLAQYLPEINAGTTAQRYFVRLTAKKKAGDKAVQFASQATLTHLGKAGEPKKPPGNPYACGTAPDNYARKVTLSLPEMAVGNTSSTTGDGDRDELYLVVRSRKNDSLSQFLRLPGYDDYYEAKKYAVVGPNDWTNKDGKKAPKPTFYVGTMKHGDKVAVSLTAMEQDNSDLDNIKQGLIDAMLAVVTAASASNTSYGAAVAAAAATIAGASGAFIPNTEHHDYIGVVGVQLENQCGYIKSSWITFSETSISGIGTVSNEFVDSEQMPYESRLAVMTLENQFWPNGVDYGPWANVGANDTILWRAAGTSQAVYEFKLTAKISK